MKVTLQIFDGDKLIVTRAFSEGTFRLGRSEFSDVVLPSPKVSRSQLEVRISESAVYVTNMAAPGKLKVNGKQTETDEVKDGDRLEVGPYDVVLLFGEREAEVIAPSDENGVAPESPEASPEPENAPEVKEASVFQFKDAQEEEEQAPGVMPQVEGALAVKQAETVVDLKPVVAKLVFSSGPRAGEEIFLEAFEVTLGRSKKADIHLDDEKLSRLHSKITRVGMGYRLIDLNSRNGTYVNGMRVLEHPLSSYDAIEIGNSKISFLIHDMGAADFQAGPARLPATLESTKSLHIPSEQEPVFPFDGLKPAPSPVFGGKLGPLTEPLNKLRDRFNALPKRQKRLVVGALILILLLLLLPGESKKESLVPKMDNQAELNLPPSLPKEFSELSQDAQRSVEGHYVSAVRAGEEEQYETAVGHLKRIHEVLPYYKNSREIFEDYSKRLREKQILEAQERAKRDEKQDLAIYLEEGTSYLREGDFTRAAESFHSAIVIDPKNQTAKQGLRAAELKITDISQLPPEHDPEGDKRKKKSELYAKAVAAFNAKSYQEAIRYAEEIRQIQIKGETQYLNEAKQIIDKAKLQQKEEFEPFLIQARERYAEGDYGTSRDLCEEMLKRDPAYDDAQECLIKAKKQLLRLAKEAYVHGYVLESMNRIEEAKQYWNRAKNYVRKGDDYYDKIIKKLENYQ